MLFDFSMSTKRLKDVVLPEADQVRRDINYDYVEADFWGEHCIECGVPHCYKSCAKFMPTPTGWCRRFKDGIVRCSLKNGGKAYGVHLLPWGRIGIHVQGWMIHRGWLWFFTIIDQWFCSFMLHLLRFCNVKYGRPNPVSYYCAFRSRIVIPLIAQKKHAERWIIEGLCDVAMSVRCSISSGDRGEVFVRNLEFKRGFNAFEFDVSDQPDGYYMIASMDGLDSPIYFTRLAIVAGGKGKSVKQVSGTEMSHAKFVKCVAWDLDNTLWNGIISEDGDAGVSVRTEAIELVKALDRRGIVNTICSKNDYELAWGKLESLGLTDLFVFPQINWRPKSENLKETAKNMNINTDAFAFIDDSVNERNEVQANVPGVRVFMETELNRILGLTCFNPPLSEESPMRRFSYLAEMKRKKIASFFSGSQDEFLRDCNICLTLESISDKTISRRCYELVNRTNQLTLAARRYTENEFTEMLGSKVFSSYAIRCVDRYGDYGIVGFVALVSNRSRVELSEFVMSCRVAAKKCEQSVIAAFAKKFSSEGFSELAVHVVRTERNKALIDAFVSIPFNRHDVDDKNILFVMPLDSVDELLNGLYLNKVSING